MVLPLVALSLVLGATAPAATPPPQLPGPPYPQEALAKGLSGTVVVRVRWNREGFVDSCHIVRSSGQKILDRSTVTFIKQHWECWEMARGTLTTPIVYRLSAPPAAPPDTFGKTTLGDLLVAQGFTTTGPATEVRNAFIVTLTVNGKPFNLTIDTGSPECLISREAVRQAGLRMSRTNQRVGGANGVLPETAERIDVSSLRVGGRAINPRAIYAADFQMGLGKSQGILGLGLLQANHAVIVASPPLLFLNSHQAATSVIDRWLRAKKGVPVHLTESPSHHLELPVSVEGFPTQMVLDTGAQLSIISEDFLHRSSINVRRVDLPMAGIDGRSVLSDGAYFSQISLGDFALGQQTMMTGQAAMFSARNGDPAAGGLLGYDYLGGLFTVIDTAANRVYFRAGQRTRSD